MPRFFSLSTLGLTMLFVAACGDNAASTESGGGGSGGSGLQGGGGSSQGGAGAGTATGGSGAGTTDCTQVKSMLDLTNAVGAGDEYEKPALSSKCTDNTFVVDGNGIPHYAFVPITPNALVEQAEHYEIPRFPKMAALPAEIPLLGTVGFAVNGQPFFGPNEGAMPAAEAYGDPVYNGIMDPCLGHTAFSYHYHALEVKCLNTASLVEKPWMNQDPSSNEPSPIVGWANDGFPVYGPLECSDAGCSKVVEMKSGFVQTGNPKTNAWDAYTWQEHAGDGSYLDECNGHMGADGSYHYHATSGFPYIIGCYRGDLDGGGAGAGGTGGMGAGGMGAGGMGAGGGMMMGPKSCASEADCVGACPLGSAGCTCNNSAMGMICVPTCTTSADCPSMGGMTFTCNNGICVP